MGGGSHTHNNSHLNPTGSPKLKLTIYHCITVSTTPPLNKIINLVKIQSS